MIWITGLSAVGKTSTAETVVEQLRASGEVAVMLDGDAVRDIVRDASTGHDRDSRIANAYRICRLAQFMAKQDLIVVVATMSLFHEIHHWNRDNLPGYFEVLIEADLETLRARDFKGVYGGADGGEARNVVGVDLAVEFPEKPNLVLDNDRTTTDRRELAADLLRAFRAAAHVLPQRGSIGAEAGR
ncbi:MAG: adenylyl-sulfate kinase [Alphaproteobacteria bacterium]|nr:adenylyl-sulfate kinase [Alphaproteobacteria bacterium]MDP6875493.1 adenylyl-sulfate kinase [Alphaproteobacteria bacterium]